MLDLGFFLYNLENKSYQGEIILHSNCLIAQSLFLDTI